MTAGGAGMAAVGGVGWGRCWGRGNDGGWNAARRLVIPSKGNGHNHELIARTLKGRRERVVVHSKTGSPRTPDQSGVRGGGSPEYLARVCGMGEIGDPNVG